MAQANQVVAGVGAALLLIGQFLPMVSLPFGLSMSFIDLPWKAVTIGLKLIAEDKERAEPRQQRTPQSVEQPVRKADDTSRTFSVVIVIMAVLYPMYIFAVVAIAFFQICCGNNPGIFAALGGLSFFATVLYGTALLLLSTQAGFRGAMVASSPGVGWAVVSIGTLVLTCSSMIGSNSRNTVS